MSFVLYPHPLITTELNMLIAMKDSVLLYPNTISMIHLHVEVERQDRADYEHIYLWSVRTMSNWAEIAPWVAEVIQKGYVHEKLGAS